MKNTQSLPFLDHLLSWRDHGKTPVIAEIKVRSAKEGPLMEGRSVESVVAQYVTGGAACLSVVTGRWFGGDSRLFEQVRALTDLPLLRKDFIVSRKELDASKAMGANAVLLTRRLLRPEMLTKLAEEALALELTPFVEVADEAELETTVLPRDAVLAINNRDIRIKETDDGDYQTSLRLSHLLSKPLSLEGRAKQGAGVGERVNVSKRQIGAAVTLSPALSPQGRGSMPGGATDIYTQQPRALVSASGIRSAQEATSLIEAGFDGLLIGTALLRSPDIEKFLNDIRTSLASKAGAQQSAFTI
jgi:indole-3-glycerol phosphate synthase